MSDQIEFYSFAHVVAVGRRKMLLPPQPVAGGKVKDWEVYVRLLSGSSFSVAQGLGRKSSARELGKIVHDMGEVTGCTFITVDGEDCIPFEHVARLFVDGQENEFATILEDSSGAQYTLQKGSKVSCQSAVEMVAGTILQYLQQKGTA